MTTTAPATRRPALDPRRVSRLTLALLAPIGPVLVLVLRYVLPYETTDGTTDMVREAYADPDAISLVLWCTLGATLALVPGAIGVARLVHRHAPLLTLVALALTVPAYLVLPMVSITDHSVWMGVESGASQAASAAAIDAAHPTVALGLGIFVVGHVLGTVLLGLAMLRSGLVPAWAAIATAVSQPLHFVAAVVIPNHALDGVAWGLNAAGFAAAALAIARTPDDDWDLPPSRK